MVSNDAHKERQYFYSLEEFSNYEKSGQPLKGVRYLKGLGSLSIQDWEVVMASRAMFRVKADRQAGKYMDIAFGLNANKRKKWLEGVL